VSQLHLYMIGAISRPMQVEEVWVTSPSAIVTAKREYAQQHGLRETQVWAEHRKNQFGYITKEARDEAG